MCIRTSALIPRGIRTSGAAYRQGQSLPRCLRYQDRLGTFVLYHTAMQCSCCYKVPLFNPSSLECKISTSAAGRRTIAERLNKAISNLGQAVLSRKMLHERTLASDCCSLVALVLMYVGGPNYRWRALSEQVNASHGTDHLDHQRASAASTATLD